jgi:hypothetical protein
LLPNLKGADQDPFMMITSYRPDIHRSGIKDCLPPTGLNCLIPQLDLRNRIVVLPNFSWSNPRRIFHDENRTFSARHFALGRYPHFSHLFSRHRHLHPTSCAYTLHKRDSQWRKNQRHSYPNRLHYSHQRRRLPSTLEVSKVKLASRHDGGGHGHNQLANADEGLHSRAPLNVKGLFGKAKSSKLASKVTSGYKQAKKGVNKQNVKTAGKALVKGAGGGKALVSALGNTVALYRQMKQGGYRRRDLEENVLSRRDALGDVLYLRDLEKYLISRAVFHQSSPSHLPPVGGTGEALVTREIDELD